MIPVCSEAQVIWSIHKAVAIHNLQHQDTVSYILLPGTGLFSGLVLTLCVLSVQLLQVVTKLYNASTAY